MLVVSGGVVFSFFKAGTTTAAVTRYGDRERECVGYVWCVKVVKV